MTIKSYVMFAGALAGFAIATAAIPANALSMQECSAKYEAAKKDGSLGTKKWNDFRKAECAADPNTSRPKRSQLPLLRKHRKPPLLRRHLPDQPYIRVLLHRSMPPRVQARVACILASISTMPTKRPTATVA